jgi:hypothetical protein
MTSKGPKWMKDELGKSMLLEELGYRSFLLRLWCVKNDGEHSCRASLEFTRTGQKHSFTNLDALNEFLRNMGDVLLGELDEKGG